MLSGFEGIYDVDHFIRALRYDVQIVVSPPDVRKNGKSKKMKAFQVMYFDSCITNSMQDHIVAHPFCSSI